MQHVSEWNPSFKKRTEYTYFKVANIGANKGKGQREGSKNGLQTSNASDRLWAKLHIRINKCNLVTCA